MAKRKKTPRKRMPAPSRAFTDRRRKTLARLAEKERTGR
jgi:hypothetical protein